MSPRGESSRALQGRRRSRPLIVHPQFANRLKKAEKRPIKLYEKLVREFYASMVSNYFFAWGTLPSLPQTPGGVEVHPFFVVHNPNLAKSLWMDTHRYWSNSNNHYLFYAQLHLESAFWHVFCDHSILLKIYRTMLTLLVASMVGIDRAVIGGKTLVPKVLLSHVTYNKLANQRCELGLPGRRVR
ncbi:hypothetical protein ACOSQ2_014411 [Xanthoceras sorbifolium]